MRLLSNSLLPRHHTDDDLKAFLTSPDPPPLHIITPLLYSTTLSARTGHRIFLKLDALQPSGSFKLRGIGRTVQAAVSLHGPETHIVAASGGNAGLAAATAAQRLGVRCTVVVPRHTELSVVQALRALGATVENATAEVLDDADALARALAAGDGDGKAVYVHPFESFETAKGHASLVPEIRGQLLAAGVPAGRPDVVTCSVGGGGLLRGIIHGIEETIANDPEFGPPPKLVACQDFGAHSFGASFNRWLAAPGAEGEQEVVTLEAITSQATSLGAKTCSAAALSSAISYYAKPTDSSVPLPLSPNLSTVIVSDAISASACWQFERDHGMIVEMACGAALAPIYLEKRILDAVLPRGPQEGEGQGLVVVVIVCGGSKVDSGMLDMYRREYGVADEGWRVMVDGEEV